MISPSDSATATLRARTAGAHHRVDSAYSAYDLAEPHAYRAFLLAHAGALPAAERFIAAQTSLPSWRPRTPLLAHDLAALGMAMPEPRPFGGPLSAGYAWGVLYVIEGSRLGGAILAGRVAQGLAATYLQAKHLPSEWRTFGRALDSCAQQHDEDWLDQATAGANACFELYSRASTRTSELSLAPGPTPSKPRQDL